MKNTNTKTTTNYMHRMREQHTYEWHGVERTIDVGEEITNKTKTPYKNDKYFYVLGHGIKIIIPNEKVEVVKLTKVVTTELTEEVVG
jgi:hypothetical protein